MIYSYSIYLRGIRLYDGSLQATQKAFFGNLPSTKPPMQLLQAILFMVLEHPECTRLGFMV